VRRQFAKCVFDVQDLASGAGIEASIWVQMARWRRIAAAVHVLAERNASTTIKRITVAA
jgi:hypothetical protein